MHITPHAQKEYMCFEQEVIFHRRLILYKIINNFRWLYKAISPQTIKFQGKVSWRNSMMIAFFRPDKTNFLYNDKNLIVPDQYLDLVF